MIQKAQTYIRRYKQQYEWHPQGRVGATISSVNGYLFLIGGRANNLINDVAIIKQPKQYNLENKWNSLELYQKHRQNEDSNLFKNYRKNSEIHQNIQQQDINNSNQMELSMFNSNLKVLRSKKISFNLKKADYEQKRQSLLNQLDDFTGRYNHTACVYQNDIIIFGGEQEFDKRYNKRSVLNEVYFFNTVLLQWSKKICRGDVVEPRRNHTAVMIGSDMVVFGGLNCFEKVPNDLVYLDVIDLHWKRYGEQGKYQNIFDNKQGALCYHQSCAVYEDIQRQKLHSMKGFKASHAIIEQGIYIYGGKFDNNKLNKNVYVLNTFQYPATWKKIEPKGVAPKRRYMHTMQFDQKQKVLIIAGGITENKDILYNNDIWILKLGPQIEWMEVNCINQENLKPVANFAATMEDSQIYIFGGIHMKGFYNGELVIQEYDQTKVNQLKEGYSQEQQEETEQQQQSSIVEKQNSDFLSEFNSTEQDFYTQFQVPKLAKQNSVESGFAKQQIKPQIKTMIKKYSMNTDNIEELEQEEALSIGRKSSKRLSIINQIQENSTQEKQQLYENSPTNYKKSISVDNNFAQKQIIA
ncbi:hypothetical protein PPERSA_09768 [Pseudocohnilembus persalinus]|uniref:Galactose oxidase/kelch, beta-propeller n=1 Tax=Pseudocohnilembus persalinus TaxID=266149 RepID=A0A0V0QTG7_PSEPJ|nr:hypothetical protein PPERSA_09768 [Pseudocohnilembus persalinus]|eukprot:KRX05628.1 hypothetical protein PPERSA_09768 [Pseudocohnilembus persalinus]